jgi:outer membrane protein OmpA-like peptidoglycan-associated protein
MNPKRFLSIGCALAVALTAWSSFADSDRGPFYVQAHVVGATVAISEFGTGVAYPIEVDFGYHVGGTHEGFVLGLAQRFDIGLTGGSTGATAARFGWDFAIPIGERELTIAPYLQGGVLYPFAEGEVAGLAGIGVEGRFFPFPYYEETAANAPVRTKRVVVKADSIEINEKIQFKANEAVIEDVSFPLLKEIADVIKGNPQIKKLRIEGHASSEGDAAVNQKLSEERAAAVKKHLVSEGSVNESTLTSEGYGATKSIADNESEEGREKNRRVEFNILEQDKTIEKLVERKGSGAESGFYIVAKPIEFDLAIATEVIPVLAFQAGVGWAF